MHFQLQLALGILSTLSYVASQTADQAANGKTKQVFNYIAGLAKQSLIWLFE